MTWLLKAVRCHAVSFCADLFTTGVHTASWVYHRPPTKHCSQVYKDMIQRRALLQQMEDSEMEEEEDSQADGFVVDDGYLSEGEGRPMDVDEFEAGLEGTIQKWSVALVCDIVVTVGMCSRHEQTEPCLV